MHSGVKAPFGEGDMECAYIISPGTKITVPLELSVFPVDSI